MYGLHDPSPGVSREPVAVVGIGVRFPGARDPHQLWAHLRDRVMSVGAVPHARFAGAEPPSPWGGFVDEIDAFDAAFFGISPREATCMDPQQRLALETAWDALDDGGLVPLRLRGTQTGVFLGAHRSEYGVGLEPDLVAATGSSRSGIAGRISYALGLEGPSLVLDTDRSSSLVALLLACRSLRDGECALALAGGVNLVLAPEPSIAFSRANMLAPDGRIKFCDARANGIVRSDGIGIVALKLLSAARRDRDPIYAVILGGAINHDGGRSGDLMTPSSASQAALLRAACDDAQVSPHDLQYVEAHGTGTVVGDPIEVEALARVLQSGREPAGALRIGSVKTNLGHTEAAAGIAGVIKVALALKHRMLPASLHFETPNPRIPFGGIVVQHATTTWPDESRRLVAGVTSLGLTGVNAHAILAEAPREPRLAAPAGRAEILAISARGRAALVDLASSYLRRLREEPDPDLACAAATRRSHLEDRIAVVGASPAELARELERVLGHGDLARRQAPRRELAFVIPEDAAPVPGAGAELLSEHGAFRAAMIRCDAAVKELAGWSLIDELGRDAASSRLGDPEVARPCRVALAIAVAEQWRAWGIEPDLVAGSGAGELAAAQIAGALTIEQAMHLACRPDATGVIRGPARLRMISETELESSAAARELVLLTGVCARRPLLDALAALYVRGFDVAWERVFTRDAGDVSLPGYPWQRERFWAGAPADREAVAPIAATSTRDHVLRELASVLGLSSDQAIDPRRGFRELGVTSLLAMELLARLGKARARSLPASLLFDHPNVDALVAHLDGVDRHAVVTVPARDRSVEPIAVVGIGLRFPGGADSSEAFWKLLHDGVDAIREVPATRWDIERWYDPEPGQPGKMRTRWGGFLDDVDRFDAAFFGISPREAEEMDPQQRLLLEVAWDALEHAGHPADRLAGSAIGVFLGLMNNNDYVARKRLLDDPTRIRAAHATGMAASIAAGRLAYLLGSTGPALVVDTACSSSLVAVHLAMRSLRLGECSVALAGGANVIVSPELSVAYSQAGMLSPTGRCRTFSAAADGYVRSEGCGIVVLERLSDAIASGHRVLALLAGAAVNHDGRSSGLTAPNGTAQRAVVRAALADAGVTPEDIDYVEAHGTGTRLGDPIEFHALGEVFAARARHRPVRVGSVKTNLGHLEAAAGIAGLIKVVLALQHRELPPHLHLDRPSPLLAAGDHPLEIPTRPTPWQGPGRRCAGVSSFGFSGTNAHVVVTEAPASAPAPAVDRAAELVVLSAKSERALRTLAGKHAAYLEAHPELAIGDVAFTLAEGRSHHPHRMAMVATSRAELAAALAGAAQGRVASGVATTRVRSAWLFTGQGAQRPGMGQALAAEWPVFASALDDVCAALDPQLERPLRDVMWAPRGTREAALLDETGFTQPALFALAVALAALWRSWGAEPDLVTGHSIGELAAAHVAGVLSLEDAARLVAARARLMQALPRGGAMISIAAPAAEVAAAVSAHARTVAIAAINGPASVVISGDAPAALAIAEGFSRRGIRTGQLAVSHAFHSPRMDPMLDEFRAVAASVTYRPPRVPGVSNVTGAAWGSDVASAEYWVRHVREPVRFADGIAALHRAGVRTFVELGPRPTLVGMVPACVADEGLALVASMRPDRAEPVAILEALGGWYTAGATVDWSGVWGGRRQRVELPTYAWDRQSYWLSPAPARTEPTHAGLARVSIATGPSIFEIVLSVADQPWLADHRVDDEVVVPAASLLRLLAIAAEADGTAAELAAIFVRTPLRLAEGEARRVQIVIARREDGTTRIALYSRADGSAWTEHVEAEARDAGTLPAVDLAAARARCAERIDVDGAYDALAANGLGYGPAFRSLRELWRGPGEAIARAVAPDTWDGSELGPFPALADAALQAMIAASDELHLPLAFERVVVHAPVPAAAWIWIRYAAAPGPGLIGADVTLLDDEGRVRASLTGCRARRAERSRPAGDAFYRIAWQPIEAAAAAPPAGRWAAIGDPDGLAAEVCARLREAGVTCTHADWGRAREALPADHVVCIVDRVAGDPPAAALEVATAGLDVVQLLATQTPPPRVWWITRGAASVERDELPQIAAASLWGLARTAMHEHPELRAVLVDVPAHGDVAGMVLAELSSSDSETELAWRAGRRFAPRLERAAGGESSSRPLRTDGTVLVTGGLGGAGAYVARWLAERGVRHLVLAGRRGERTPGATELGDELRALGAQVMIAAVDVADRSAVAAMLAAIPAELPLRGVVHAAGTIDDGVLSEQTSERFARVMAAKVAGAWHLDELTRDADLDMFVMFSSVAGAFGSAGQASYAAANTFLDALAAHRRARGLAGLALAWGPWDRVGMTAALDAVQRQRWEDKGLRALAPEAALALLELASHRGEAHLVVAPLDLVRARRAFAAAIPSPWRGLVPASRATVETGAGWLELVRRKLPGQQLDAALELVRAEIARLLSLDVGVVVADRPLAELGLDSLMALELRNAIGRRAGVRLPTTLAFDYPSAGAIAKYLVGQLEGEPIAAASQHVEIRGADEPIAIVGYGCRFPGDVTDPDSFWRLLAGGVDAIREVPKDRWDIAAYYDPDPGKPGKMYTREGGFLNGLDRFEPEFFEISPREAIHMDPQQRLLLETSWEALERAGISPASLLGANVGVFVGVMSHEYLELQGLELERRDGYVTTGSLGSVASGRISYALGVQGPSMTIDTACSSSLVATHLACQALRAGECDVALAGGATVVLTPSLFVEFSRLRGLSRDGRCKSFAAAADGVIWSEGCGVIALKRLRDADRDRDRVLGVIVGSAVNQDGRSQGLTAPNGLAQQDVIRRALAQAKLGPAAVDYVEAHGTGTRLGDPIEMQALGTVLARDPANPVIVGSLKSNIGHAQAAAGVGGIIKTLLALEHELIPRSLHFDAPSPHIPWAELPVKVASEALPWPRRSDRPRIAGISSFGISGTNAHLLVQEPPAPRDEQRVVRGAELVVVSAKSEAALAHATSQLASHLATHRDLELGAVVATLATGRTHHAHRRAVVARSLDEARRALETTASSGRARGGRLAWLFTGQGSQVRGMGSELAADWPVFARELDRVARAFDAHLERPLRDVMWADPSGLLDQTAYTQPALFALEVALAALWKSWGVEPDVLVGHSIGELAAAHVAGVFGLEDAARLVASRGRLMQALPGGGAMVSIAADEDTVARAVAPHAEVVSIAAVNGPSSVVISGARAAVDRIAETFASRGVRTWPLVVSHAFHSPLLDPMLDELRRVAESIEFRAPRSALVSNLTGTLASEAVTSASYWVEHARRAVRFAAGVRAAHDTGARTFLELGPRATLLGLVPACVPEAPVLLASVRPDRETPTALESLGELYTRGASIRWDGVYPERTPVELPTYPWQRGSYWVPPRAEHQRVAAGLTAIDHPVLRGTAARPGGEEQLFTAELDAPWLMDHRVFDTAVVPGAALVELALAIGQRLGAGTLVDLTSLAAVPLAGTPVPLQIWANGPDEDGRHRLSFYARVGTEWICHARGMLAPAPTTSAAPAAWPPAGAQPIELVDLYERLAGSGLRYGESLRGLRALWRDGADLYARVELRVDAGEHLVHPALLDASLHALPFVLGTPGHALLPFEWHDVAIHATGATHLMVRLTIQEHGDEVTRVALDARDGAGESVLRVGRLILRRATAERVRTASAVRSTPMHRVEWVARPPSMTAVASQAIVVGGSGALAARLGVPRAADLVAALESGARVIVDATERADDDVVTRAHRATHDALALLQSWLARPGGELVWVTRAAIAATDDDSVEDLGHAPLWGLVRSARREHPSRGLRVIDVDASSGPAVLHAALAMGGAPELAVRGGKLLAPRLAVAAAVATRPWRTEGTALVTGATGALGMLVARHLVLEHGVRHLLLASRRGAEAPEALALRDELVDAGARVTFAACDVGDRRALATVLERIAADAPLRAVFHCAGVVDDGLLASLDSDRIDRVFAAKLDAAAHLHELTRGVPLDAFVLFSSVAGILGTAGQANYAAANTFLDALAAHRRHAGLAGQSLAWGLWEPSSRGMTAGLSAADVERIRRQGIAPLSIEQGLALLDEALVRTEPLLVPARLEASVAPRPAGSRDVLTGLPPEERRIAVRALVRAEASVVLRLPERAVPDDEPLRSLGLDSLMAVELGDRLGARLGVSLSATLAFDHPTVAQIVAFVETLLPARREQAAAPLAVATGTPEAAELGAIDRMSNEDLVALVRTL